MAYSSVKTFGRRTSKLSSKMMYTTSQNGILNWSTSGTTPVSDLERGMDKMRIDMIGKRWETFFRQESSSSFAASPVEDELPVATYIKQLKECAENPDGTTYSKASTLKSSSSRNSSCSSSVVLKKLKHDFSMASTNFRLDFIQQNGITMLCGALKKLQDEINVWENAETGEDMNILKNKMVDEFHCIMCIKFATRDKDGCYELLQKDSSNLETACQSLLSPCMQSRIAVMDLLANLIHKIPVAALRPVLQQFTTLRLRYAQHDRFRFLVGMSQASGKLNLLFKASLLGMMNEMLMACPSGNYQVYLQTELEEAGLNVDEVEKTANTLSQKEDSFEDAINVVRQVSLWRENYIMVDKPIRKNLSPPKNLTASSPVSTLPTYEYGTASAAALSSKSLGYSSITSPDSSTVQPRSTGEIKVIIKSISPIREPAETPNYVGTADIHPPPVPPPPKNLKPHIYSQNPVHRQSSELPGSQEISVERMSGIAGKLTGKKFSQRPLPEVPAKFGATARQIQSSNLNQRMADKFSGEYNDWRRKRSGDSVDSGESSDSADSHPEYRGAVYLVDGVYPAQKAMIDDVMLQFDRAYDALEGEAPSKD